MPTLNMDALMNERAQQLGSTQTIINKDPDTIRVSVDTFRQATYHNLYHNNPNCPLKAPTALDGSTIRALSDNIRTYVRINDCGPTTKNSFLHNGM